MHYTKPKLLHYRLAQVASWFVAFFIFGRKILRNEIKEKAGPYVVIANHEAALDFVNLIGLTHRRMTFVISRSFYNSLPIRGFLNHMGVISKQQFQTTVGDMKRLKAVIDNGQPLVLYPAGLMCEDGLSTPIPAATYKFLKWLKADVYIARTTGTYFAMPKWAKDLRPGKTCIDVYRLFSKEELAELDVHQIRARAEDAILFDAYREQEQMLVKYRGGDNIEGLENVLYMCPHCGAEFSMAVTNGNAIGCSQCGFELVSDEHAFLHNHRGIGPDLRYVSDWSKLIYRSLEEKIISGQEQELASPVTIHMVDHKKKKYAEAGKGTVSLSSSEFHLCGRIHGSEVDLHIPIKSIPTLPFSPGKYFEIQHGDEIYRCLPDDGRLVMKFINMVKLFFVLRERTLASARAE